MSAHTPHSPAFTAADDAALMRELAYDAVTRALRLGEITLADAYIAMQEACRRAYRREQQEAA